MVTTRRSSDVVVNSFDNTPNGGVALLERPRSVETQVEVPETSTNCAESERMQRNLQKLLNYDRFTEEGMEEVAVCETQTTNFADEDIRPTSTTMQFGDDNIEQIREEMNKSQTIVEEGSYHVNAKGKIAIVLYSLIVAVIMALIVLNTGILATVSAKEASTQALFEAKVREYSAIVEKVESISSPDYVIDVAENQLGMVKGN